MRYPTMMLLSACLLAATTTAAAADPVLDCSRRSLANAVAHAHERNRLLTFTGTCEGPIVVQLDGLELRGVGTAVIDGGGQDAVTVAGASGVVLSGIEVRNGRHGIVGVNGAHLSLSNLNVHDSTGFGISLQTGSINVTDNLATGLTIVSGAHMVSFGGTINASGNRPSGYR